MTSSSLLTQTASLRASFYSAVMAADGPGLVFSALQRLCKPVSLSCPGQHGGQGVKVSKHTIYLVFFRA